MGYIRRVSEEVLDVLKLYPDTRNSDDLLYYYICRRKLLENGYGIANMHFADVWLFRKEFGIPPFETVRRTRQKIQQTIPELRGDTEVEAMRMVKEEEYRAYARGVNA